MTIFSPSLSFKYHKREVAVSVCYLRPLLPFSNMTLAGFTSRRNNVPGQVRSSNNRATNAI